MLHSTAELPLFCFPQEKSDRLKLHFFGNLKARLIFTHTNHARFIPPGIQRPYTYWLPF